MKIYGICGSPRKGGNSQYALEIALQEFEKEGCQVKKVLLSEANIKLTDGSLPEELEKNPINDDMQYIKNNMIEADIIIFSSPTYFDNITPQLKNFIDRTDPFYKHLKDKKALILVVGQADEVSWEAATNYLKLYCEIAEISVKGTAMFKATNKGDLEKTVEADQKIQSLVHQVIWEGSS